MTDAGSSDALRTLRDRVRDGAGSLTFADLSRTMLEDLALGWLDGEPFAFRAAEMLSRIDGIPATGRAKQLAGRAALTILERDRAANPESSADQVKLLGEPEVDEGDPEAVRAFDQREREYESLTSFPSEYDPAEFAADVAGAFAAARSRHPELAALPQDAIAVTHRLALLGLSLPAGLRAWFHDRYGPERGAILAWKFTLASRTLARHRDGLARSGLVEGQGTAIPDKLLAGVLATPLGDLARTGVLEP
ncbi:MAG: hypothetical protein HMLKMBBP_01277 [Planctomycetes bacterium]|nr:hypothetical protein [Planctomycetota bacterium]